MAFRHKTTRQTKKSKHRSSSFIRSSYARRLHVETLEDRRMLAVFSVSNLSDAGEGSLRNAISQANSTAGADEIVFSGAATSGTIALTSGELEITDALTITGPGQELLMIDAQQNSRVLNFSSTTGDLTLEGLTVTGGQTASNGGGIRFISNGALALTNSTVSGNSTTSYGGQGGGGSFGGGIYTRSGSVTLTGSTVSGNSTTGEGGGGISTIYGSVTLTGSTVSGNSTTGIFAYGGGIHTSSGSVTLTSSTVSGNSSYAAFGGGIYTHSGSVALMSSTVSGNSSARDGGGISTTFGSVTLTGSTVSGNSTTGSGGDGGGIRSYHGNVTLMSSTVSGNSSFANGGGIFTRSGSMTLISSTVSGNAAGGTGGGVFVFDYHFNRSFTIENSIVAGNTDNGSAPDLRPDPDSTLTIDHSLLGDTALTISGTGNLIGTSANPIDPLLGPLADNGGPTETHALLPGSFAIDAGDPTIQQNLGQFDQRGTPYTRVSGGRIDMGAHERQTLTVDIFEVASLIVNPVEEVSIQFSSAASGFDRGDLKLSLNGGENLLTDSQTLSTSDNQTFVLGDLADVTTSSGYYTLDLVSSGSGIVDADGGPLDTGDSISWAMGRSVLGLTVDTLVDEWDGSIDDGDISLRDAIAAAAAGETIDFDASLSGGTILLTIGELPIIRAITIDATSMAAGLVVDASGTDPTPVLNDGKGSRLFDIDDRNNFVDSPVTIRGLTLTGGDVSGEGGAIRARETLIVNDSTISGNSAGGSGGGIWAHGDVMVTSSTISANSANSAPGTYPYGGGIWGRTVNVTSSTISGNSANGSGGGIYARDVVISLSTISGNSAFRGGGIIGAYVTVVTSSTISGNGAEFIGGGIHAGSFVGTVVTIENSIVAGNTDNGSARSAPDVDLFLGPLGLLSIEYSLVGDNTGTGLTEAPVGAPDANGNLIGGQSSGIINPLLGPLADNGGPTQTHALLPGSPAIDAGDPMIQQVLNEYDQRGEPFLRVADGDLPDDLVIDMGAYEAQSPPSADFDSDNDVDGSDFLTWQRGYGITTRATKPQGNSDDDEDVDDSDLAAWEVSVGNDIVPLASALSAVSDQPIASPWQPGVASTTQDPTLELGTELRGAALALVIAKQRGLPNYDAVIDDGLNLETPYEAVYALGDLPPPNRVSSGMSSIAYPDEMDEQQGDGSLEEAVDAALMSVFG